MLVIHVLGGGASFDLAECPSTHPATNAPWDSWPGSAGGAAASPPLAATFSGSGPSC